MAVVVENVAVGVDTRLRKQVDDLLDAGFDVSVVTRRHPDNEPYRHRERLRLLEHPAPPDGTSVAGYAREYAVAVLWATVLLGRLRVRRRVDVLQLCQPPDLYFPLAWVLRLTGARVVLDQRDLMPELLGSRTEHPPRLLMAVLRGLERESCRVAHHVVTVNDYLAERLRAHHPATPVSVVRNGPVLARVDAARRRPVEPGSTDGRAVVVWVGKMGPQDRVDLVVRAAEELVLRRGRGDVRFVVLGDGECLEEVTALTRELGLDAHVDLTGWVDEATVFAWLAAADVGVDASLQEEVTPVKALEYMAFGLPFACFDLTETRALAPDAAALVEPGDLVALADALEGLLDDPRRRRLLGRRGRRAVESRLAWERQAPAYLAAVSPQGAASGQPWSGSHGGDSRAQAGSSQVRSAMTSPTRAMY